MKTTRRKLLGLLGLGAAAAAMGAGTAEAAASEQTLLDAVLATPEQYPEIMAKAREYQGSVGITPQWRQSIGNDTRLGNYTTGTLTVSGDCTFHDSAYLQGMIDQAAASGGGVVRLTKPEYVIARTIDLRGKNNVTIDGNGALLRMADDFQGEAMLMLGGRDADTI